MSSINNVRIQGKMNDYSDVDRISDQGAPSIFVRFGGVNPGIFVRLVRWKM